MKDKKEILEYRENISQRFRELEKANDNETISVSKANQLRRNYNIQLHLIRWILNENELSDLLLKEI